MKKRSVKIEMQLAITTLRRNAAQKRYDRLAQLQPVRNTNSIEMEMLQMQLHDLADLREALLEVAS